LTLERGPYPVPHQIDEGYLLSPDEIGVERDAIGDGPNALEEIVASDIGVECIDVIGNRVYLHSLLPSKTVPSLKGHFCEQHATASPCVRTHYTRYPFPVLPKDSLFS